MRDATREVPDGFHLAGLSQALFQLSTLALRANAIRNVTHVDDDAAHPPHLECGASNQLDITHFTVGTQYAPTLEHQLVGTGSLGEPRPAGLCIRRQHPVEP